MPATPDGTDMGRESFAGPPSSTAMAPGTTAAAVVSAEAVPPCLESARRDF